MRWIRRLLDMALIVLVVSVLGLVLAVNLGPALGHQLIVIRGSSMEPNVHLGSVIEISKARPPDLRPGDIVTLKEANGVVVSHRITRLVTASDGLYIETKGDANASVDATLTPVSSVIGRADLTIAGSGYILYMLGTPTGVLSIVCLGMTMLFAIWLLEELEEDDGEVQPRYESDPANSLARGARASS
jgi:signal peptidase